VFDSTSLLFTADNLQGSSTRQGLELAAVFKVLEQLELGGSYTFTDSTEENEQGQKIRELRRPRHSGSLHANFRFRDDRANLLLLADYGGRQDDIFYPPFPAAARIETLGGFWLLGLTAGFDISDRLNVFARVTNLLDEQYEEVYGYRTMGRASYLGLRLQFGR
jgi:vitamin B12 transporter